MTEFATRPVSRSVLGHDTLYAYVQLGPYGMEFARRWADKAIHYSGIKVGVAAVAASKRGDLALFGAANQNLYPGANPTKACAEPTADQKAAHRFFNFPVGKFISGGPVQPDTQSGLVTPTMHMCGECRDFVATLEGNDSAGIEYNPQMLLTTVHPDRDEYEIYTYEESVNLHAGNGELHHFVDPGFERWDRARMASGYYRNNPEQFPGLAPVEALRQAIAGQL